MKRKQDQPDAAPSLWLIVRRFSPYIGKRRWLIGWSFLAMLFEVAFRVIEPWPLKFIFDRLLSGSGQSAVVETISSTSLLTICAATLVAIVAGRAVAAYLRRVGFALAGNLVMTEVRAEMFSHLQRLSLSFHGQARTGDLTTRVTNDIGRLQEVVSTAALPLLGHAITILAMAVVMLIIDWRLALLSLAVLPLFWLATRDIGSRIRTNARRERQRHGELGAIAAESMGSIGVVQALSAESVHKKRFNAQNLSSLRQGVRGKRLNAQLLGSAEICIALGTAIVLWYGARLVMLGQITAGDLIVFLAYLKTTTRPIRNVAKYSGRLAKASASAERVLDILDATPEVKDAEDAVEAPRQISSVVFEGVSFAYREGEPALTGIDIEARVGCLTALTGHSGAGKSSMMNLLLRLYDPSDGRVAFDGRDIRAFTLDSLRSRIAIVPQDNVLFHGSVRDNITMGLDGVSDEQMLHAARLACADEFVLALPEGFDTLIQERGLDLSVGQRQRLSIARAAVRNAPILVLDEPTANLDAENTALVYQALVNLSKERVCFLITHDARLVQHAGWVVMLENGAVQEQGEPESLLEQDGLYAVFAGNRAQSREAIDAPTR